MPHLGDYLGMLLSEITIARMDADIEAMRVGELYAQHPLLKHLPVPRFRLPSVELSVPVVIQGMDEPDGGDSSREGPPPSELRKTFDSVLSNRLHARRIHLSSTDRAKIRATLDECVIALEQPRETSVYTAYAADTMAHKVANVLRETRDPRPRVMDPSSEEKRVRELEDDLKVMARIEFLKLRSKPPRLQALVTTSEVREVTSPESVAVFRLRITEDAVEWTSVEGPNGEQRDRLVPE